MIAFPVASTKQTLALSEGASIPEWRRMVAPR
jgi:hypothetical protein